MSVEDYYDRLMRYIREKRLKVVFPPKAVRRIVENILIRCREAGVDPESLDWMVIAETLPDFRRKADLMKYLEDRGIVPRGGYLSQMVESYEGEIEELRDEIVRQAEEALGFLEAAALAVPELKEVISWRIAP